MQVIILTYVLTGLGAKHSNTKTFMGGNTTSGVRKGITLSIQ